MSSELRQIGFVDSCSSLSGSVDIDTVTRLSSSSKSRSATTYQAQRDASTRIADEQKMNDSGKKPSRRFSMDTKAAKQMQQESIRTVAVQSIADSAMRTSDAIEDRNAIEAFSRPEVQ